MDLLVDRRRHCPLHWHPLDEQSSLGRGRQQWQGVWPSVYPAANPPMASPLDPFLWLALPNSVNFVDFFSITSFSIQSHHYCWIAAISK